MFTPLRFLAFSVLCGLSVALMMQHPVFLLGAVPTFIFGWRAGVELVHMALWWREH